MCELPFDPAIANRFISNLSKSLQALCHGCMDFDTGIEIVGYLNVNIDSGSKVDYVLNEKVLKSTTNSMTFVSNSFFAKKDQPKQTRDGACSPILQYHPVSTQHRTRGFSYSSLNRPGHRGAYLHRSLKRGVGGEWRGGAKRSRIIGSHDDPSGQFPLAAPRAGNPAYGGSSSNINNQLQTEISNTDSTSSLLNIKKETLEESDTTQPNSEGCLSADLGASEVNVKTDPDASHTTGDTEGVPNNQSEVAGNQSSDFQNTFLQPHSEDNENADHSFSAEGSSSNQDTPGFDLLDNHEMLPETQAAVEEQTTGAFPIPESSDGITESADNIAQLEYDNATDETTYPEYPDAGEGSSSGQFEVIEIDDEDEDMQAMFGSSHTLSTFSSHVSDLPGSSTGAFHPASSPSVLSGSQQLAAAIPHKKHSTNLPQLINMKNMFDCSICADSFVSKFELHCHFSKEHGNSMPFTCLQCGKGYLSKSGLEMHIQVHQGKSYPCPLCDARFTQKSKVKRHIITRHGANQCPSCHGVFQLGREYNKHILTCNTSLC